MDEPKFETGIQKLRNFYNMVPNSKFYQKEFWFFSLARWKKERHIPENITNQELNEIFGFDESGLYELKDMGWEIAPFFPLFEEKKIKDVDENREFRQDSGGRDVLYFKGRTDGYMPEYVNHPVKDFKSWEKNCKWRLDKNNEERNINIINNIKEAKKEYQKGKIITANLIGGYMYLRSLMGPIDLLYLFYDNPKLIHECMKTWYEISNYTLAKYQEEIILDEFFIGEDICYNHGSLISPAAIKEFLFPYYIELFKQTQLRQKNSNTKLHFHLDTDGFSDPIIDLYKKIGMDYISPFEVASNCDVVRTRKKYPDLLISGGFDKRILASTTTNIDREVDRIMPFMKEKGGYIPTCDHGVPEEVSFSNYMHYRKRMSEF